VTDTRTEQLELFPPPARHTAEGLRRRLERLAGRPVELIVTRNAVSLASVRFSAGAVRVRLHEAFLAAPAPTLAAIGEYLRSRSRTAWRALSAYADTVATEPGPARLPRLTTRGRVFDLAAIRNEINRRYFGGRLTCRIGWGRRPARRPRFARSRTIRYGCYVKAHNLVRINPILDDPRVPPEFVAYIVFHEMLHAVAPSEGPGGRRRHHHATFRDLERRYPDLRTIRRLASELVGVLASPRGQPRR
jgi:hypothetical protein